MKKMRSIQALSALLLLGGVSLCSLSRAGTPAKPAAAPASSGSESQVSLKGQVVCSSCWGEDDRTVTPYGTQEDIKCAVSCNRKGIPPGLAVKEGKGFSLFILAEGKYAPGGEGWVKQMGKYVEASGVVTEGAGKKTLTVDALKGISASDAGFTPKPAS